MILKKISRGQKRAKLPSMQNDKPVCIHPLNVRQTRDLFLKIEHVQLCLLSLLYVCQLCDILGVVLKRLLKIN